MTRTPTIILMDLVTWIYNLPKEDRSLAWMVFATLISGHLESADLDLLVNETKNSLEYRSKIGAMFKSIRQNLDVKEVN